MTQPAFDLPLSPRERLRWRRAMDARLAETIFGRVVRDASPSQLPLPLPDCLAAPGASTVDGFSALVR